MDKPLRIVQILPALNDGGVERGAYESNREYARRGHESIVISSGGTFAARIVEDGGRHITLGVKSKNPLTFFFRAWQLARTLRRIRPDVIHVRSRVPAWLVRAANRRLKIPVVSTVHGMNSVSRYSRVMTEADRVICVSRANMDYVTRSYGTPESKIRLIHRGIDLGFFNPQRLDAAFMADFRETHRLSGKFVVMAVGRITAWKGYDVLIKAIAELAPAWSSLTAVVVGGAQDGKADYAAGLKKLAADRGIAGQVIFTGSQTKVPELYALADVVVSSTVGTPESFGRNVAEAIAMNRPVIASRHGGVLDIVKPGVGWLVPPGDVEALANAILTARAEIPHMTGLRDYILENFSLDRMVEKTLAVYREVT